MKIDSKSKKNEISLKAIEASCIESIGIYSVYTHLYLNPLSFGLFSRFIIVVVVDLCHSFFLMVQHYCSICLPEFARRRVYMYVCARIQTHTHKKGFSPYKINIYLSHASLVRRETLSNSIQSFFFSLAFSCSLFLFYR